VVVAVFIYKINVLLEPTIEPILQPTQQINKPKAMSNEQLCTESRIFAQRMRDFENERYRQHDEAVDRLRMTESKTKEEKISGKQSVEFTMQWLNQYNSDFTDKLLPQARFLRAEMLSRLPPQPKNNLELDTLLFGSLAGVRPIQRTADQLETWAKKLCPSP
jgi:hypothetical protein